MQFFGLFSLVFGAVIIAFPQFLAYLIGFFFVLIGVNILFISTMFRNGGQEHGKSWKVGGYEIIKNRK